MRFPLRLFTPLPAPLFERPSPGRIPERRLSRAVGRNDYLMIRLRSSVDNDAATLFQLLHRRNRLRLIFRAVARDVAHELLSDGNSTDASKADSGVAERACDLRSQARPVGAFDLHRMNGRRGAHARFLRGAGHFGPFDRRRKQHPLAPVFRSAPREHHFEIRSRLGEPLELVGYASRAVVNTDCPDFRLRRLECHSVLHLENGLRWIIYSHRRTRGIGRTAETMLHAAPILFCPSTRYSSPLLVTFIPHASHSITASEASQPLPLGLPATHESGDHSAIE